jgi:hypothetical protein
MGGSLPIRFLITTVAVALFFASVAVVLSLGP